ncbi:MAG: esterase [Thalassolituus sp.]
MFRKLLLVVAAAALTAACSHNGIYRSQLTDECTYQKEGDCKSSALQVSNTGEDTEYRLGFIEYDDQGQLWQRKQQDSVIDRYLEFAGKQDVIVLTFVHGWHHSAKPEDGNIQEFREMLEKVSASEAMLSSKHNRDRRPVLGVYIGWRGDSISIPVINHTTFWGRKATAHEVGRKGVTEALLRIEELVNVRNTFKDGEPQSTSRLVVIGHSFGGAVVYSSLQKILTDRFIDSRRGKNFSSTAQGFGDMVILMNPAFEAMRFASLQELSQVQCRGYFPGQLPKLAILTSETDYATKWAFPAGRIFSTMFESHRTVDTHVCPKPGNPVATEYSQGKADRNTVGHYEPFLTHRLDPAGAESPETFNLERAYFDWSAHDNSKPDIYTTVDLKTKSRTTARNPYMNIVVDKELMDGHNDIWGDAVIGFISELITVSTTPVEVYEKLIAE